jgi:hypothetical protein
MTPAPNDQPPIMASAESLPRGRRGLAVAALVAGVLCITGGLTLVVAPFAFILGALALRGDGVSRLLGIVGMSLAGLMTLTVLLPFLTVVAYN